VGEALAMTDTSGPSPAPQHVTIDERSFARELFWQGIRQVAGKTGHGDHDRYLTGAIAPTNVYTYMCATCQQPIVAITVIRQVT
jgi:hypothetical protein